MIPEKEKQLFEKYSFILRGRDLPLIQNLLPFGMECGDGWFNILDELCYYIEEYRKEHEDEEWAKDFIITQIKEKYGGLRFYHSGCPDAIYQLVRFAEGLSLKTCEECGAPGETKDLGWVYTRCPLCFDKLNSSRS